MTPSLDNLLVIMGVAFAAPLVLGLFPRVQLPSVVLEIVAGIVVGPAVSLGGAGGVTPSSGSVTPSLRPRLTAVTLVLLHRSMERNRVGSIDPGGSRWPSPVS